MIHRIFQKMHQGKETVKIFVVDSRQAGVFRSLPLEAVNKHTLRMPFNNMFIDFDNLLFVDGPRNYKYLGGILLEGVTNIDLVKSASESLVQTSHLLPDDLKEGVMENKDKVLEDPFKLACQFMFLEPIQFIGLSMLRYAWPIMEFYPPPECDTENCKYPNRVLSAQLDETMFKYLIKIGKINPVGRRKPACVTLPVNKCDIIEFFQSLMQLAVNCLNFINSESVVLERTGGVDNRVNAKRIKKGKLPILPYYEVRLKKVKQESKYTGSGTRHRFRYDVRGHFRHYKNGKIIWVQPHQRGLAHDVYVPKVYKVGGDKNRTNEL